MDMPVARNDRRENIWNHDCHKSDWKQSCRRHKIGQAQTNNSTEDDSFVGLRSDFSLIASGRGANI